MNQKNNLHIAHIVDLRVVGGIERILVEFIKAAPHVNHSIILFDKHIHPTLQKSLLGLSQLKNVMSTKHWHGIRLPKSLRASRRRQLIQSTQANVLLNWSQVTDLRGIDIPQVFYEHGSAWENYDKEILNRCYDGMHHAIAVSHAAKRMLQLNHHFKAPCEVIYNTVFESPQVISSNRHISLQNGIVLGAAGRLVERKNFSVLIKAVSLLNQKYDVRLLIAGTGPQSEQLNQLIQKYELQSKVTLLGYVANMSDFYKKIDVFVNPSLWEAMPMVAIEAFAAGVPIIGTATDGLPEIVMDGLNGICIQPKWNAADFEREMSLPAYFQKEISYQPNTDDLVEQKSLTVDDLVQAIENLLQKPENYQKMSAEALKTAQNITPFSTLVENVLNSVEKAIHD